MQLTCLRLFLIQKWLGKAFESGVVLSGLSVSPTILFTGIIAQIGPFRYLDNLHLQADKTLDLLSIESVTAFLLIP